MRKFFVKPEDIGTDRIFITDPSDVKHMVKVLRAKEGDSLLISDGYMWEYTGCIEEITDDQVILQIVDKQKSATEPFTKITLFQGVPKGSKMETIVQKTVELGVYEIVPVFMERTIVTDNGKFDKKIQRWQKISAEAVKQCKRGIIPEIAEKTSFTEMEERLKDYDLILLPYENEEDFSIKECLRNLPSKPETVAIIIGPEGGFADYEADKLVELGAVMVTLGKTILRTETAGMAAIAMTMYELEL